MNSFYQSIVRRYTQQIAISVTERSIAALKQLEQTLSGDDSGLENIWEEICVQAQGEQSTLWDEYLAVVSDIVSAELEKTDHLERVALWLQTDEGMEWEPDYNAEHEGFHINEEARLVPYVMDDIVNNIVSTYLLPIAGTATNDNIEAYLDHPRSEIDVGYEDQSDDAEQEDQNDDLVSLMPVNSLVCDLWNWDIHFENEAFDNLEEAAFADGEHQIQYATQLAEKMIGWVEEYDIDLNRGGWESEEQYKKWINDECVTFMKQWRENVREAYGR